jgi:hypothetical protein
MLTQAAKEHNRVRQIRRSVGAMSPPVAFSIAAAAYQPTKFLYPTS